MLISSYFTVHAHNKNANAKFDNPGNQTCFHDVVFYLSLSFNTRGGFATRLQGLSNFAVKLIFLEPSRLELRWRSL